MNDDNDTRYIHYGEAFKEEKKETLRKERRKTDREVFRDAFVSALAIVIAALVIIVAFSSGTFVRETPTPCPTVFVNPGQGLSHG